MMSMRGGFRKFCLLGGWRKAVESGSRDGMVLVVFGGNGRVVSRSSRR
jgi:hypothetical protein